MNKIILIVFVIGSSISINAQKRTDTISNLKKIIKIFSTEGVGYGNAPSKNWYAFIYLHHILSNEELEHLTFDKIPEIRVYAFMALSYNNYSGLKKIRKRLSSDKGLVSTLNGCIGGQESVQSLIGLQDWNFENSVSRTLEMLNDDTEYRKTLYESLLNNKPIKRATK